MGYAIRSLAEVVTCLHKAKRRNYISEAEFSEPNEFAFNLMNMMIAFTRNIKLKINFGFPIWSSDFSSVFRLLTSD